MVVAAKAPWWHTPGEEMEKCSVCKSAGTKAPCQCTPVAFPLLAASKAWTVIGLRFNTVHAVSPSLQHRPTNRALSHHAVDKLRTRESDRNTDDGSERTREKRARLKSLPLRGPDSAWLPQPQPQKRGGRGQQSYDRVRPVRMPPMALRRGLAEDLSRLRRPRSLQEPS